MATRIEGVIRPNKPYVQHAHGDIIFTTPRQFVVDGSATAVRDKKGEPLVLTPKVWEELRQKFGGVLVCEPVDGGGEEAARAATEMRQRIDELELAADRGRARIGELEQEIRTSGSRATSLERQLTSAQLRIAELEQQSGKPKK